LRRERILASPRFRDGRFRNTTPVTHSLSGSKWELLGEFAFGGQQRSPPGPIPLEDPRPVWARESDSGLRMTWLGHSTVLLELDGVRILTDPVFGQRASPFPFGGPARFHPTPVALEALGKLDAVLVSHDHYDHLCMPTIRALARRGVPFVTSLGVGAHLEAFGVAPECISELDWWEEAWVADGRVRLTATPAQHFSGRGMRDRNQTLWASWAIRSEHHHVFFSGDTGLTQEFAEVGQRLDRFDVALFEVGAFHPAWGDIHLGPENALRAHALLGSGAFFPVHWGTFTLGIHAWDEPVETMLRLAQQRDVRVLTPRLGRPFEPRHAQPPDPWWRSVGGQKAARWRRSQRVLEPGRELDLELGPRHERG
jgi:L-ascorbate metabolism protein UlaG (beta-lactamase superfamily)